MNATFRTSLPVLLALGLLASMGLAHSLRPRPGEAEPYHREVRGAVQSIPYRIGDWVGLDQEVPRSAIELLRPNVLFNRLYRNVRSGRAVTMLVVHCKDARDLAGHYPPICYPAHGWTEDSARPQRWDIGSLLVPATEYEFSYQRLEGTTRIVIANFMVLPDGSILPDMGGVRHAASDYTQHFYGAAQIQLVVDASVPEAERDQIIQQMLGAIRTVIDTLRREQ